ncbi:MAG TPA: hypothetical protein ENN35_05620, partial [Deltaproteobacteria bacterium]|nr:hypothetical protein [Deltaproteobacteria bacterium]
MESRADYLAEELQTTVTDWESLEGATDRETFASSWLAIQCASIRGCVQAILILVDSTTQRFLPVASWPEGGAEGERLADVLEQTLAEGEGMLVELARADGASRYGLAYPIMVDDECLGAVAVEVATATEGLLRRAMESLKWGT